MCCYRIGSAGAHGVQSPLSTTLKAGICPGSLGFPRSVFGLVRVRSSDMNCPYDDSLKEDVERTIGIRVKDTEKIQFCGLLIFAFMLLVRTFIIIVPILMIRCI